MAREPQTWILTGSPENFEATRERGFSVIGMKEKRRRMAEQVEPGDRIVFYLTRIKSFGAIVRVTGELYEDRAKIWPGQGAKRPVGAGGAAGKVDPYPWRFATEPELVLDEAEYVPAEDLVGELEHIAKWPREHWTLAFQGQLRTVSDADARAIEDRMRASRAVPTG